MITPMKAAIGVPKAVAYTAQVGKDVTAGP